MELLGQLNEIEKSYEDLDDLECSPVHAELTNRMRKTLYAGRVDSTGISLPLTDIVVELFENADQGHFGQLSKRHVANLTRRSNATQCSLFLSMIYAKRLRESNPDYVTRIKPAELFLVSMMIATKFLYDEGEEEELYNDEWAEAAKIDVNRVHDLEMEFLAAIDWKLLVDPLDFYEFLLAVETRIALSEGRKRGWFTYTDLSILMQHPAWYEACFTLLEHMVKVISVCTLIYTLCAATTMWSALILHQASIPPQPSNGCLPLPLGTQLVKSTETHQVYNHLLLDLVLHLYLTQDPGLTPVLPADTPATRCDVPWYKLERPELSREGLFLGPSSEGVSQETAGDGMANCQCCLNQGDSEDNIPQQHGCRRSCCSPVRSWSQSFHNLATRMSRLKETLVMFYSALLAAWSETSPRTPSGTGRDILDRHFLSTLFVQPLTACINCRRSQNSSDSALQKTQAACSQTVGTSCRQAPLLNDRCNYSQQPWGDGCQRVPCQGKENLVPSMLSDWNVGFRTSSEILVTM